MSADQKIFFLIALAQLWVLASPFVTYKLFKAKRPWWACFAILLLIGVIAMDWFVLVALAGVETFRN